MNIIRRPRSERELRVLARPAIIFVLLFTIFPLIYSVWVSVHNFNAVSPNRNFVGLRNFADVLTDPLFIQSAKFTLLFVLVVVPIQTALGLGIAILIERDPRLRRLALPVFMVPLVILPITVAFIWKQLWNAPYGVVNQFLSTITGQPVDIDWVGSPETAFIAVAVTEIWQWTPFMILVLLAALVGIPQELREAAEIDASSAWLRFRSIIFPAILPVLTVALAIRVIDSANLFSTVYGVTGGGPGNTTYSIVYYIQQLAAFGDQGRASAASLLFLVALVVLVVLGTLRAISRQSATSDTS